MLLLSSSGSRQTNGTVMASLGLMIGKGTADNQCICRDSKHLGLDIDVFHQ